MHDKPQKKNTHGSTIWCTTNSEKKHALEQDLVHYKPRKKNTHWSTVWCTTNREKKHALESLEHDLVHDRGNNLLDIRLDFTCVGSSLFLKGTYGALNGGIFGASSNYRNLYYEKHAF